MVNCLLVGEKNTGKTHYLTRLSAKNGKVYIDTSGEIFQMDACPNNRVVNVLEISNVSDIPKDANVDCAVIMIRLLSARSFDKWYTALREVYPTIPIVLVINTEKCVKGIGIDYIRYFTLSKDASLCELEEPLAYVLNNR